MFRYFLSRLRLAVITILGVSLIVFVTSRMSGDVTLLLLPQDASQAEIHAMQHELGLDAPYYVQYFKFLWNVAQGDFGQSLRYHESALGLIMNRLPATLELAFSAFVLSTIVGLLLGIVSARMRGSWFDYGSRIFSITAQSMPSFWVGIMLILVFAVELHWLPTSGAQGIQYLVLPVVTLALVPIASTLRITRSAMLETLDADYVKFLRVKGLAERFIVWKHAFRNALVPVIAISGLTLGFLIGGTVIIESVFAWPGLGNLMVEAIFTRDYPVIQAGVAVTSVFLILLNLAVDLLFGVVDPRVRFT
ncbi:MAG TPA: ABC transporter permease [Stellaceae bacterium]|jgi:ABC-type dipeptide/oligopeptide/nickel transport system permease component|nr:ABC transporter permease [Stellaceae bacterium]